MSLINTDPIWFALGDFFSLFPDEERVYWNTFWESYSDVVADLWGLAFQADRAKSLFSTTPTMERREVLVQLTNLVQGTEATFRISNLKQDAGGRYTLRGFVPRDFRSFKASNIPDQGVIRIGVDIIPYTQVNVSSVVGGLFDGFVREATFVLDEAPPHDYSDDPDFNDDFAQDPATLKFRINQVPGNTVVDAVLLAPTQPAVVNPSGLLQLGIPGLNSEIVEYESVTIIGDRYVFQLATSWQPPDTNFESLGFAHFVDEELLVQRYDQDRWVERRTGLSRITSNGDISLTIDQLPTDTAAKVEALGQHQLQDNVDFDVSVIVTLDVWDDPIPFTTFKQAYTRLNIGPLKYNLGVKTTRLAGGDLETVTFAGLENAETEAVIGETVDLPYSFEARFKRVGGVLEFQFRPIEADSFSVLAKLQVSGSRSTLDLVAEDPNSDTPSRVRFDEVIRRAGGVAGSARLEEFFTVTEVFPYTYDIDQVLTQAPVLQDRPRPRTEFLSTTVDIIEVNPGVIKAVAEAADFEPNGVPKSGVIEIRGTSLIYDELVITGDLFEFHLRGEVDPNIVPTLAGTVFTATTRVLAETDDYQLSGTGQLSLRELPTRERMWAPVAQIDIRHVQNTYGILTDLDAAVSNETYLNRVQGTWSALMLGAAIRNVESGLQLAMGLPVARIDGTVTSIFNVSDDLGRITQRVLVVLGEEGSFEHSLQPDLFPFIDWSVIVGDSVDRFQPLTNGVEVLDVVRDNNWYQRFPGVSDIERFNAFGIFVALEALTTNADVNDAIRFALRIKPTYTKLFMRFLLTSGNEDLSDELDDDAFFTLVPNIFEDMSFDEGTPPESPFATLRLGEGHKLGQSKKLGTVGYWNPTTLGTYARQGPFLTDGQITQDWDHSQLTASDGAIVAGSGVFTTGGAHVFVPADVGKHIIVSGATDGADNNELSITEYISATQVRLVHNFATTEGGLSWDLRVNGVFEGTGGYGFVDVDATADGSVVDGSNIFTSTAAYTFVVGDVGKTLVVLDSLEPADNDAWEITEFLNGTQVRLNHVFGLTSPAIDWRLRSPGFVAGDVDKNIHIKTAADPSDLGDHKIIEILDQNIVRVLHTFVNTETDLDWELRSYLTLGSGVTLGELRYFKTPIEGPQLPQECVESEQVVTVATTP